MMSGASLFRFEKAMRTFACSGDIQAEFLVFWKLPPDVVWEMGIHHLSKNVFNTPKAQTCAENKGETLLVVVVIH